MLLNLQLITSRGKMNENSTDSSPRLLLVLHIVKTSNNFEIFVCIHIFYKTFKLLIIKKKCKTFFFLILTIFQIRIESIKNTFCKIKKKN